MNAAAHSALAITGLVHAYGMGVDLATFLATFAVVTDGKLGTPFDSTFPCISSEDLP